MIDVRIGDIWEGRLSGDAVRVTDITSNNIVEIQYLGPTYKHATFYSYSCFNGVVFKFISRPASRIKIEYKNGKI